MSDEIGWVRLADYLSGQASLSERVALERWMRETPARERMFAEVKMLWDRAGTLPDAMGDVTEGDVRRAWHTLADRMQADVPSATDDASRSAPTHRAGSRAFRFDASQRPRGPRLPALRVAAVILAAAGGVLLAREIARQPAAPAMTPTVREIAAGRGQRTEIRLDDGSHVILSADSKLRWPATFGDRQREVELEGEALFVVTHDASRPFVVRSGNAVIRDVGTEFGVNAYADDRRVRIAVRSGAVEVGIAQDRSAPRAILRAGDVGTLATDGVLHVQHVADIERELAFAEGRLEFADLPMSDVARQLERWYDVRVTVSDSSLVRARVSASFDRDEELGTVLRVLSASLGARVTSQGRTVHFDVAH